MREHNSYILIDAYRSYTWDIPDVFEFISPANVCAFWACVISQRSYYTKLHVFVGMVFSTEVS